MRIWSTGPSSVRSQTPAQQDLGRVQHARLGALGEHDPALVGAGRLQELVLEHHRREAVAARRGDPAGELGGVGVPLEETERGLRLARGGRVQLALQREEFGGGGEAVARHRQHRGARGEAGGEGEDLVARHLVQGEQHTGYRRGPGAVRGERADDQVRAVARGDHQASRGQGVQEVRQHRAAEHEVQRVPGQPGFVAEDHPGPQGLPDLGDGGRGQGGLVRHDVTGHRHPAPQPLGDLVAVLTVHPVGDHGEHVAAQAVVGPVGVAGLGEHRLGGLCAAAHDRDHGGAELVGEAGVQRELVRELGVGEVGAEDQDDVEVAGHQVEAVDEGGDQLVGAALGLQGGGLVVVEAVDGGGVLGEPVAGTQQFEEPVGTVVHQRPEHPHPVDLAGQQLHDPQLDDLAAVAAVDPGHVHAAGHA